MKFTVIMTWIWLIMAAIALYNDNQTGFYIAIALSQSWGISSVILGAINGKD